MSHKQWNLNEYLNSLDRSVIPNQKPVIFNPSNTAERQKLSEIIAENKRSVKLREVFDLQWKELEKIRHPREKLKGLELDERYREWCRNNDPNEAGRYVYYPWRDELVHLLAEPEFRELRTSRNQYKITPQEQNELAGKTVGVIGLSVGQSVALTLAMERSFGCLRIADFDHLELSNLNRIRRGVGDLGLPKTTIVAREIAEIDPYLTVETFDEGITEANLGEFLDGGGQALDLLIEECDSLDIKIQARWEARKRRIPVLMDTSDRGLIDIERFDLEPERPLMHGMIREDQAQSLGDLSSKERLALVMDMVGVDAISQRLKASLLEVDESLTTWPQLASSVIYGGAICGLIARYILLGYPIASGRHYFDPESKLGLKEVLQTQVELPARPPALRAPEMLKELEQAGWQAPDEALDLKEAELDDLLENACHAPSGGNMQPWKWVWWHRQLFLFHDRHFSHSFLDHQNRGSLIGLGAALENLAQRAAFWAWQAVIEEQVESFDTRLIARIWFLPAKAAKNSAFGENLKVRLTNRVKGQDRKPIERAVLDASNGWLDDGFGLRYLNQPDPALADLAEVIAGIERQRILDPWGHRDFVAEARWTAEEAEKTRDGVDLRTLELEAPDMVGLKLVSDEKAIEYLRHWKKGSALRKMSYDTLIESSALGLLYHPHSFAASTVLQGGRNLQRIWLYFNHQGIAFQPVSPATFMFARLRTNSSTTSTYLREELLNLRSRFLKILSFEEEINDLFLFRLFYAHQPMVRSLRKELGEVFINSNQA